MLPSTEWKETVSPDESHRHEDYAEALRGLQRRNALNGSASRALHAKGLSVMERKAAPEPDGSETFD